MESFAKIEHFRRWVFWTGIFNIGAYSAFLCPVTLKTFLSISNRLGDALGLGGTVFSMPENVNHVIMINILGLLVVFLFFLYYVLFSNATQILLLFGIVDLIIGIIYMYYIFTIKDLKIT